MITHNIVQRLESTIRDREWEAALTIESKEAAADGVTVITLVDALGDVLPEWSPGAHIDLILADDITRQYSLCGDPANRTSYRIGVLRDPSSRGGSRFIHDQLEVGSTVQVRGPRNHFPLVEAEEYLFIAGGIGITPILPMIAAAENSAVKWRLLYGGRSIKSMAFINELSRYGEKVQIFPEDKVGRIPLASALDVPNSNERVYVCGPSPLIDAVEVATSHWPTGSVHTEHFSPKTISAPPDALESFEVVCERSGITLKIDKDQTILGALEKAGVKVLASCRAGVCGTCEVDIIGGKADHRDTVLSREERVSNEFMLVCCSRSLTPQLVLDV